VRSVLVKSGICILLPQLANLAPDKIALQEKSIRYEIPLEKTTTGKGLRIF